METRFFSEHLPQKIKEERYKVVKNMVDFIAKCVSDRYNPPYKFREEETFRQSVNSTLFNFFKISFDDNSIEEWYSEQPDTKTLVVEGIRNSMKANSITKICAVEFTSKELTKALIEEFQATEYLQEQPEEPTVENAYKMAVSNLISVETAIVFLTFVKNALKSFSYDEIDLKGYDEIRDELFNRRNLFLMNILLFGSIVGGGTSHEATKTAIEKLLYNPQSNEKYCIIHYLQPNGIIPGSFAISYNKEFLKDIIKHYENF